MINRKTLSFSRLLHQTVLLIMVCCLVRCPRIPKLLIYRTKSDVAVLEINQCHWLQIHLI